jgi:hypothetical protein
MKLSGFSFTHNCIAGGYPLREAIRAIKPHVHEITVVDMQSTDSTRDVLRELGCNIVECEWGHDAEGTLGRAHALHTHCKHDNILHFEADEVWDDNLISAVKKWFANGSDEDAVVHRIQVEQNFQRIRWNPHPVHRLFRKGFATKDPARGHTTKEHDTVKTIFSPDAGLIWDCSYVFRDNHKTRMNQNAELWGESPQYLRRTPDHFLEPTHAKGIQEFLSQPQWTWKTTPLRIPEILLPLVGVTKYE